MKNKATKKETFEAHYQEYMASRKKKLWIFLAVSVVVTVILWKFMATREMIYSETYGYSWWALTMMLPVMVKALLTSKAAGNYARRKLKRG